MSHVFCLGNSYGYSEFVIAKTQEQAIDIFKSMSDAQNEPDDIEQVDDNSVIAISWDEIFGDTIAGPFTKDEDGCWNTVTKTAMMWAKLLGDGMLAIESIANGPGIFNRIDWDQRLASEAKNDRRGRWWQSLSAEERSAVGKKAAQSRKRNERKAADQEMDNLMAVVSKIGVKKSLAILSAVA
jgi:hypothetical protein